MTCPLAPNLPVVCYLRHSPGDKQTIYAQQAAVKAYCEQNALTVIRTYTDEARSGTTTAGRNQFLAMIDAITTHQITPSPQAVIVYDLSRFGRNLIESQFYIAFLRRNNCDVVSMTDEIPQGDLGPVFETLIHWEAQQAAKRIGQKAR
jgi:DNA invertase Pin-like site-specific DNA recombinase